MILLRLGFELSLIFQARPQPKTLAGHRLGASKIPSAAFDEGKNVWLGLAAKTKEPKSGAGIKTGNRFVLAQTAYIYQPLDGHSCCRTQLLRKNYLGYLISSPSFRYKVPRSMPNIFAACALLP